jgi:hypothetical protein
VRTGIVTEVIPFREKEDRKGYHTGYTVVEDSEGEVHYFDHCAVNQVQAKYQCVGVEGTLLKTEDQKHWTFNPTSEPEKESKPQTKHETKHKPTGRQLSFKW